MHHLQNISLVTDSYETATFLFVTIWLINYFYLLRIIFNPLNCYDTFVVFNLAFWCIYKMQIIIFFHVHAWKIPHKHLLILCWNSRNRKGTREEPIQLSFQTLGWCFCSPLGSKEWRNSTSKLARSKHYGSMWSWSE